MWLGSQAGASTDPPRPPPPLPHAAAGSASSSDDWRPTGWRVLWAGGSWHCWASRCSHPAELHPMGCCDGSGGALQPVSFTRAVSIACAFPVATAVRLVCPRSRLVQRSGVPAVVYGLVRLLIELRLNSGVRRRQSRVEFGLMAFGTARRSIARRSSGKRGSRVFCEEGFR